MKTSYLPSLRHPSFSPAGRRACGAAMLLVLAASLSACGNKTRESKPGQTLASVDGHEITVLQLNEELQRAGVPADKQDAASKQLLQALVDRQLLENEATKEKLDRDPKVMEAVDRARSLIIAQAYMQKHMGSSMKPTDAEIEDYFNKHPEFFTNRKQFSMNELIIPASDLTAETRAAADSAKSLEEVAVWLDAHKIKYGRSQVTRSTADLAPQLSQKLLSMPKGQLFIVKEGDRAMLISIAEVHDAPVTLDVARQQIAQYLMTKKNKELASAELQRLRSGAKIEYMNKSMMPDAKAPAGDAAATAAAQGTAPAATTAPAPAAAAAEGAAAGADKAALDRGVAGLK